MYYYLVPDLGFVERGLRNFEKKWNVEIVRVPSPGIYRMLRFGVFQSVRHMRIIDGFGLPQSDLRPLPPKPDAKLSALSLPVGG